MHAEAFPYKVGEHDWFAVHRAAHDLGIPTNATMLYGHIETPAQRIAHLVKLREHQDESLQRGRGAFNCMVPLSFVPAANTDWADLAGPQRPGRPEDAGDLPADAGQLPAHQGLLADPDDQAGPGGPELGRGRFRWHGGLVRHHEAEGQGTRQQLDIGQLRRLICEAGYEPVERDCFYNRVIRAGTQWSLAADLPG